MKIKKKIEVSIDAELGSDFQMECFETALTSAVQAIAQHYNGAHKQNKLNVKITGTDERWTRAAVDQLDIEAK